MKKAQRSISLARRAVIFTVGLLMLTGCAELLGPSRVLGVPERYLAQSDQQLWDEAIARRVGHCRIIDRRANKDDACRYYLKVDRATWMGGGWPVDPATQAGSGCVAPRETPENHVGPSPAEYRLASERLRSAIADPSNPCGLMKKGSLISNLN